MKVHYVGKLIATGKIFGSSFHTGSQPFRFTLGSDDVVEAWNRGLVGMCEGERRRLMVPYDLAYGAKGAKGTLKGQNDDALYTPDQVENCSTRLIQIEIVKN